MTNSGWGASRRDVLNIAAGLGVASVTGIDTARAAPGDEKWHSEVGTITGTFLSSPTVVDGTVFIGGNRVYALAAEDGTEQWRFDTNGEIESSPAIADGTVFVGSKNNNIYALDAGDGTERWRFQTDDSVVSSPTVVDGTVFVGSWDGHMYALDAEDGTEQWRFEVVGRVVASPTVVDGTIFFGSGNGDRMYAVDAGDGTKKWEFDAEDRVNSSPTVVDGTVFVGSRDRSVYAINAEDGTEKWRFETGFHIYSSPTVVDETVFIGSNDYSVYALDAEEGTEKWQFQTDDQVFSSPTVVDDVLFVGSNDQTVYALDVREGTERWRFDTNGEIRSSPTVVDGTVFVGSDDGRVYALDAGVSGASEGSRVLLGTLGHREIQADRVTAPHPSTFDVEITETRAPTAGEALGVTVTIENTGDVEGTETIEVSAGDESQTTQVTLSGGDTTTEALSLSTDENVADKLNVTAASGDDTATVAVEIVDSDAGVDGNTGAAGGGGGIVTREMIAIGGGGGVVTLLGLYALLHRSDDETLSESSPSSTKRRHSGSQRIQTGDGLSTGSSTNSTADTEPTAGDHSDTDRSEQPSAEEDTSPRIDDRLATVERHLSKARRFVSDSAYDRALERCEQAIETATQTRETAQSDAPSRVSDVESRLNDATQLRRKIKTEREAHEQATGAVDALVDRLDAAASALKDGRPRKALDHLDDIPETIDRARDPITKHGFSALGERLATLESRFHRLHEAAEDALMQSPATIPDTPKLSLTYDSIETGDPLGQGGNADVFYATTTTDDGEVELAVKEPRVAGTLHTETVERMMEEAQTWQQLDDHDHIVSVIDYGTEPLPWIAMEYMDAGHFGERAGELSIEQALWTAIATTKAVRYAHRHGVAHLDLKPENVLFKSVEGAWDAPKIADWGLSKRLLEHSKSIEGMSPHYAAPEQFDGQYGSPDDITDVYQLGAVFYELFTGQRPFEGQPFEVINKIQTEVPTQPSDLGEVPSELDDILLRTLATDKAERYETVVNLRNDLQTVFESF